MIKVSGYAKLRVDYEVELDMTEAEFDALPEGRQNQLIEDAIDWMEACRDAEVDEIDVWDLEECETVEG